METSSAIIKSLESTFEKITLKTKVYDNEHKLFLLLFETPEKRRFYVFGDYIFSEDYNNEHKLLFERSEYETENNEGSCG